MNALHKTLALTAALTVAAPTVADAACNARGISGTWLISIEGIWSDNYYPGPPFERQGQCWFRITPPHNVGIHCEDQVFFGLNWDPDVNPWHQIEKGSTASTETVGTRRFPVPHRCEWRLFVCNDLDIDYTLNFDPSLNTLVGRGEGFADKHYGSTEPYTAIFTGIRQ